MWKERMREGRVIKILFIMKTVTGHFVDGLIIDLHTRYHESISPRGYNYDLNLWLQPGAGHFTQVSILQNAYLKIF